MYIYSTTDSNTSQIVNAFLNTEIFSSIYALDFKVFAKSANASATLKASIIKRSETEYDIYVSEASTQGAVADGGYTHSNRTPIDGVDPKTVFQYDSVDILSIRKEFEY